MNELSVQTAVQTKHSRSCHEAPAASTEQQVVPGMWAQGAGPQPLALLC